jgi:hypothetical protein
MISRLWGSGVVCVKGLEISLLLFWCIRGVQAPGHGQPSQKLPKTMGKETAQKQTPLRGLRDLGHANFLLENT